ncbi:MAG: SAM-dependent methyltransferase [Thermofilaceae archaeon]
MAVIVIEHLEEVLTPWVFTEYKHAASLSNGNLIVTNLKDEGELACVSSFTEAYQESISELAATDELLVLDPQAKDPLSVDDIRNFRYVVVGGIMGDYPPRGRTKEMLTEKLKAEARHLGPCQFSVDGAVYVTLSVAKGSVLNEMEVTLEISLRTSLFEVVLPYCYPVREGKAVFSYELAKYILTLLEEDEAYAVLSGKPRRITDYGCRLEIPEIECEIVAEKVVRLGELSKRVNANDYIPRRV